MSSNSSNPSYNRTGKTPNIMTFLDWTTMADLCKSRATVRLSERLSQHRIRRYLLYNVTSVRNDRQQTTERAESKSSSTVTMPTTHIRTPTSLTTVVLAAINLELR
ncbi:hypothetical protein LAZ67_12000598 [Cordylochernes scorpioides]|uniref:Uncharacterized protein n=1 Tax=Cordylochernes scorpioides TaxID=51811 RepID=A0ABY6L0N8_9ARAC|nr:hypothetical protein LAZ67_12000598 [Cordylochernes scorpioides]